MKITPTSDSSAVSAASRPGKMTFIVMALFGLAVVAIVFGRDIAAQLGLM